MKLNENPDMKNHTKYLKLGMNHLNHLVTTINLDSSDTDLLFDKVEMSHEIVQLSNLRNASSQQLEPV